MILNTLKGIYIEYLIICYILIVSYINFSRIIVRSYDRISYHVEYVSTYVFMLLSFDFNGGCYLLIMSLSNPNSLLLSLLQICNSNAIYAHLFFCQLKNKMLRLTVLLAKIKPRFNINFKCEFLIF